MSWLKLKHTSTFSTRTLNGSHLIYNSYLPFRSDKSPMIKVTQKYSMINVEVKKNQLNVTFLNTLVEKKYFDFLFIQIILTHTRKNRTYCHTHSYNKKWTVLRAYRFDIKCVLKTSLYTTFNAEKFSVYKTKTEIQCNTFPPKHRQ